MWKKKVMHDTILVHLIMVEFAIFVDGRIVNFPCGFVWLILMHEDWSHIEPITKCDDSETNLHEMEEWQGLEWAVCAIRLF